ncbi:MAG: tetratricopeptide repeat protein [Firmicutes bacterium]|nr:tetratricopeptide repeat protein [Bacillota bacterium]
MSQLYKKPLSLLVALILLTSLSAVTVSLTTSATARGAFTRAVDWQEVVADNLSKDSIEGRLLRGIAFANLGRLPEALKEFEIAGEDAYANDISIFILDKLTQLRRSPKDLLLLNCAAFGSYAFGDFAQSISYFGKIMELDPDNVWARNFCAIVYGQLGEFDQAQHHLEQSLALDGKNQYTHLLLSAVYKEKQQYLMALYHYLQAPEAVKELQSFGII